MILIALASLTLVGFIATLLELVVGLRSVPRLADDPPVSSGPFPSVSIVVAARNEALDIEGAVASLCMQDYPALEIICVDDRSTDGTAAILDRLALGDRHEGAPSIHVLHVDALPTGWLGKNHALFRGATIARGDYLLFTDADVHLAPSAVARAVHHADSRGLDHVAVGPDVDTPTRLLAVVVGFFMLQFSIYLKPWKAADPRSWRYVGIGAFNLVRRSAYLRAGTHARIPLRPDDDLKLGKILKASGARQQFLSGTGMVSVTWYRSVPEFVAGLQKNTFAGLGYSVLAFLATAIACVLFTIWPTSALVLTSGIARVLYAGVVLVQMVTLGFVLNLARRSRWLGSLYVVGAVVFFATILSACLRTIARRGIDWRGTRYPLSLLKSNRV